MKQRSVEEMITALSKLCARNSTGYMVSDFGPDLNKERFEVRLRDHSGLRDACIAWIAPTLRAALSKACKELSI